MIINPAQQFDISAEQHRTYIYPNGARLKVEDPKLLNITPTPSGEMHLIATNNPGESIVVTPGWMAIRVQVTVVPVLAESVEVPYPCPGSYVNEFLPPSVPDTEVQDVPVVEKDYRARAFRDHLVAMAKVAPVPEPEQVQGPYAAYIEEFLPQVVKPYVFEPIDTDDIPF